jgi:hypothetical protein
MRSDRIRAGFHAFEESRRKVSLAGIGQHGEDDAALGALCGDVERGGERSPLNAAEDTLAPRKVARGRDAVVGDGDDFVATSRSSTEGMKSGVQP